MQAVILAGGRGTRLAEETSVRPKPMVEVGGIPLLIHVMRRYAKFGIDDFVICLGYKGELIKHYFAHLHLNTSDVTFDFATGAMQLHAPAAMPWRVTLVDTGDETATGSRIRRVRKYLRDAPFCLTYGDGLSNIDFADQVAFHHKHGAPATVTAVPAPARFGVIEADGSRVLAFREKHAGDGGDINAGFFILAPQLLERIPEGDDVSWEHDVLPGITADGLLHAYRHTGFWHCIDTLRDKTAAEALWSDGSAPWV